MKKCNLSKPCFIHKTGKYKKWSCANSLIESKDYKSVVISRDKHKHKCSNCDNLINAKINYCKNCYYKFHKHYLFGKKLPKKWRKNISKGQGMGENHKSWKGEEADYFSKHKGIVKQYGNPKKCEECGIKGKKNKGGRWTIQWANISGEYKRVIEDYKGLCTKCHKVFDGLKKNFEHGTVAKYREGCRCELCKNAKHLYRNGLLEYSRKVN